VGDGRALACWWSGIGVGVEGALALIIDLEVDVGGSDYCVTEPREASRRWMSKAGLLCGSSEGSSNNKKSWVHQGQHLSRPDESERSGRRASNRSQAMPLSACAKLLPVLAMDHIAAQTAALV
jgi:hypothetical protein